MENNKQAKVTIIIVTTIAISAVTSLFVATMRIAPRQADGGCVILPPIIVIVK
jgi:hypothetical protein